MPERGEARGNSGRRSCFVEPCHGIESSKWAIFGKQNWRCGMNRKLGYGAKLRANLEPTKGVGRLRQQDGGHGSQNPLRRGRSDHCKTLGVSLGGAAVGADLGGSSKYSNENFEGRRGESLPTLETTQSEVGSSGWKSTARRAVSGAPHAALENPKDRVPPTPGRTHNRIRSPRPKAIVSNEANAVMDQTVGFGDQSLKVLDHVSRTMVFASMNFKRFAMVDDSRRSKLYWLGSHKRDLKGGKITGKGKISTGKLDFKDVYFVKELKFNLFSVSQMCDKKNSVVFTDTECVVLSPNFKLLIESHVLLRVPRKDNMYNVDLKNIVPSGGRKPTLSFMRPFGCLVTILNTLDHRRTRIVEENLHVKFSEETPNIARNRPNWIFDIDALTKSMNYKPVVAGNQTNGNAGTKENIDAGQARKKTVFSQEYILLPLLTSDQSLSKGNEDSEVPSTKKPRINQEKDANVNSINNINAASDGNNTNNVNTVSLTVNAAGLEDNPTHENIVYGCDDDPNMPNLEEIAYSDDDEYVGVEADMNNLNTFIHVSPIPTIRLHKDHPLEQIIGDIHLTPQTRRMTKSVTEHEGLDFVDLPYGNKEALGTKWVYRNKKDDRGIVVRNKATLVAQGYTQEECIYYNDVFALVVRIEAIRLFLAYASFMNFIVYQIDVKSAFLYGTIERRCLCVPTSRKKFDFATVKTTSTPIETNKALLKDKEAADVDVPGEVICVTMKLIIPKDACYEMIMLHNFKQNWVVGSESYQLRSGEDLKTGNGAATTASSLEAEQDNGNINRTQSMATLNESFPQGTSSYSGPRCQNTILRGAEAQIRFVATSKQSNNPPLSRVNTLGSGEDIMKLKELMELLLVYAARHSLTTVRHKLMLPDITSYCWFWATAEAKTVNGERQIQSQIDKKKVIITEKSVRSDLMLEDAEGIECLPNDVIFEQLTLMGAKTTAWNEFSSTMASAIICLATNQKFNFSKYIFDHMMKILEGGVKFLMYARRITPLIKTMMVQVPEDMGEDSVAPTDSHFTPIITQPSLSKPQKKKSKRKQRKESSTTDPIPDEATNEEPISTHSCDPPQSAKTAQAKEIAILKKRVKQLEKKKKSRTSGLKMLRKVGSASRVESSNDVSLGAQEDASKQGRKIADLDADAEVTLIDETQEIYDEEMLFDIQDDLQGEEVVAKKEVAEKDVSVVDPVTTAGEVVTTASATTIVDELTLAQTLIEIKAAKPKAVTTFATTITTVVASTRPKVKGIIFHDEEEQEYAFTPIVYSSQLPQEKDKGKGKMGEPEKPLMKKDQIALDEELALRLHAEEQTELEKERRVAEQRSKPPTKTQIGNIMCAYLKNMGGYKHNQLKGRSYEEIQKLFDKAYKQVNSFVSMDSEVVKSKEAEMKRNIEIVKDDEVAIDDIPLATKPPMIVEYKINKDGRMRYFKLIRVDGSSKRYSSMIKMLQDIDREDLETLWKLVKAKHGNTRPEEDYERVLWGDLKLSKIYSSGINKVDEDKETAELQSLMEVIPDEKDVAIDVVPLATKSPKIVDSLTDFLVYKRKVPGHNV
ncbi:ribonuclease H-like domain-containing protein [Tanacetum coccineum]